MSQMLIGNEINDRYISLLRLDGQLQRIDKAITHKSDKNMYTLSNSHVLPTSCKTNVSACSSQLLEKPRHTGVTGLGSGYITSTFLVSKYVDAWRYVASGSGHEQKQLPGYWTTW